MKSEGTASYRNLHLSVILFLALVFSALMPSAVWAASADYCITPPFVVGGVKPNLLMMFDNSSSMFDLNYIDKGFGTCSSTAQSCGTNRPNCPTGETCVFSRVPTYCYDNTFQSSGKYVGYFEEGLYYEYDFINKYFVIVGGLPGTCTYLIDNELCVEIDVLNEVKTFAAKGSYLNWLTASKYDEQKEILTGGKYVDKVCEAHITTACTTNADCVASLNCPDCPVGGEACVDIANVLQAESRGCVGSPFIKEPNKTEFVEGGTTPEGLGITFTVTGPVDTVRPGAPSRGGQTFINVHRGDYNQKDCQAAIDAIVQNAQIQDQRDAIATCIGYSVTSQKTCEFSGAECKLDADCIEATGTCGPGPIGSCSNNIFAACSTDTFGLCTPKNGTCTGGSGANKFCVGGGLAGASCKKAADCQISTCDSGKTGSVCTVSSDCNVNTCKGDDNPKKGLSCSNNSECTYGTCNNTGAFCYQDLQCTSRVCDSGPYTGTKLCNADLDCYKTGGRCLDPVSTQIRSTFGQSMLSCKAFREGTDIGSNELTQVLGGQQGNAGCGVMYRDYKTCRLGPNDGRECTADADCLAPLGVCENGPDAIRLDNPVLLCSTQYAGYCADSADKWQTTVWSRREFATSDDCIKQKYREYCSAVSEPPVVDPTDAPSSAGNYDNLPAIIGGVSATSQLGPPLNPIIYVRIKQETEPLGLLQEFSEQIRFGSMDFQYNGSTTECNKFCSNNPLQACSTDADCIPGGNNPPGTCTLPVSCPKKCSVTKMRSCFSNIDCPKTETCIPTDTITEPINRDGGKIAHYIGDNGRCSSSKAVACKKDTDCPGVERCISVGNHNYGLVNSVDKIKAASWTPFSEAFFTAIGYYGRKNLYTESPPASNIDLRLNGDSDFTDGRNPSEYECQKNNILLISDGASTADMNPTVNTFAGLYPESGPVGACAKYSGSMNVDNLSWIAHERNIKQLVPNVTIPAQAAALKNSEFIDTYVVFTGTDNAEAGDCNSLTLMDNTAKYGGTGSVKLAEDPDQLKAKLRETFQNIAKGAGSGTAASVLASGEGSGANLLQALFYTERKSFFNRDSKTTYNIDPGLTWTGTMKNLWYYIDPFIGASTIREDSDENKILTLSGDNILMFRFTGAETVADLYPDSSPADGLADSVTPSATMNFEEVKSLWEAGFELWKRDPADRKIYTSTDGVNMSEFITPASAGLVASLDSGLTQDVADRLVSYVRGTDYNTPFCSITVATACSTDADCPAGESCVAWRNRSVAMGGAANVWKLGDIVNSTPRLASWVAMNNYHTTYLDATYEKFTESGDYKNRGMVFTGANDGMLHAFNLGKLETFQGKDKKAALTGSDLGKEVWAYIPQHALPFLKFLKDRDYCHTYFLDATPLVFEASINKPGGCVTDYWECPKKTTVDASNNLVLADTSWRTILVGNMRLGGACRNTCTTDVNLDGVVNSADCVETPLVDKGFSSYFALDITETLADPTIAPKLLWEFSDLNLDAAERATGGLGFSTTGAAILRIGAKKGDTDSSGAVDGEDIPDHEKNGRFFVVIGSGPTGPIESRQFKGFSDQPMKVFIFDLVAGPTAGNIWVKKDVNGLLGSGQIKNGFAGNMLNSVMDFDQRNPSATGFYQDEALYFGFTKAEQDPITANTKWNKGGVLRLLTGRELDPANWPGLSYVMDDIGPVNAGVAKLHNPIKKTFRLFYGSGRYFYKIAENIDDGNPKDLLGDIRRRLYGVTEPCYDTTAGNIVKTCVSSTGEGSLTEAADATGSSDAEGWYINLDVCTAEDGVTPEVCTVTDLLGNTIPNEDAIYLAERNVTDIAALRIGAVLFTTTKPSANVCSFGGGTHLWAAQYDTGGRVKKGTLRGKALVQVSTGEIKEIDLKTAFTEKDGRRTVVIPGVPPAGDPPGVVVPPLPAKKIVHMRER